MAASTLAASAPARAALRQGIARRASARTLTALAPPRAAAGGAVAVDGPAAHANPVEKAKAAPADAGTAVAPAHTPRRAAVPSAWRRPAFGGPLGTVFHQMEREMDEMMSSIWGPLDRTLSAPNAAPLASARVPTALPGFGTADISEDDAAYSVALDAPGVPRDALKVKVADGVLTIEGERTTVVSNDGDATPSFRRVERAHGSFMRRFKLPDNADGDGVTAKLENGVLHVIIPKVAVQEPAEKEVAIA